ncbi:MAG TPA: phosphotransferase family protein [Actinocrinis sp.]|nr:phosphotransferase family protein [Actinocrinis sp.]
MQSTQRTGLDLDALAGYLDRAVPGLLSTGPGAGLSADRITGGKSNLTYRVTDGKSVWAVRRPPLGHVLATAHDMAREFRVLSALSAAGFPVPRPIALCEDTEVVGAPFYLMDFVEGTVYRSAAQAAVLGPARAGQITANLIQTLARLHAADPRELGLGDFGRPDGYLERQVRRWSKQLESNDERHLPGFAELPARLAAAAPAGGRAALVHGDFRLDNTIVAADDSIAAVVDWEMSTLGDPVADLGLMIVYWDATPGMPADAVASAVCAENGFPDGAQVAELYAAATGADLTDLPWCIALGCFKLAVIAEGIHLRYSRGQTLGAGFDQIGDMVAPLIARGHGVLDSGM